MDLFEFLLKRQEEKEKVYLEFKEEELSQFKALRTKFWLGVVIAIILSWTIAGLVLGALIAYFNWVAMNKIYVKVYSQYLKKKHSKGEK